MHKLSEYWYTECFHNTKKNVPRLVVGSLDNHLWSTWIQVISNGAPYIEVKQWNVCVASHLPSKQIIKFTKVFWNSPTMPKLSSVQPCWWRKKWVSVDDGAVFRAHLTKLSFGYNPFTGIITASIEYKTEFFSEEQNKWRPYRYPQPSNVNRHSSRKAECMN